MPNYVAPIAYIKPSSNSDLAPVTNGGGAGQCSLLRLTPYKIRRMLWECGQNDDCRLINLISGNGSISVSKSPSASLSAN